MRTLYVLRIAAWCGVGTMGLACVAIHPPTQCQLYVPDDKWTQAGIQVVLESPSERDCPLSLPHYSTLTSYWARISAPNGVPALTPFGKPGVETSIWDANNLQSGFSTGYFSFGVNGREQANDEGFYYAGQAGPSSKLQQDRADTYIQLSPSAGSGVASSSVFLPYSCCQSQTLAAALPRTPRGKTVVIRTWTNFLFPKYRWYLNGAEILIKSGPTAAPSPPGATYSRVMSTPGTFTWKIVISGTRVGESKTIQFNMVVQ